MVGQNMNFKNIFIKKDNNNNLFYSFLNRRAPMDVLSLLYQILIEIFKETFNWVVCPNLGHCPGDRLNSTLPTR